MINKTYILLVIVINSNGVLLHIPYKTRDSLFLLLLFAGYSFSQIITNENLNGDTYSFAVEFDTPQYTISEENGIKLIRFIDANNISNPGKPDLPQRDIFVDLIPNSNPDIKIAVTEQEHLAYNPSLQKQAVLINDSAITYKSSNMILSSSDQADYRFNGYLWVGKNYCAHFTLKIAKYDYSKNVININKKFYIKIKYRTSLDANLKSHEVDRVSNLVLNKNFAVRVIGDPGYEVNNSDAWIDYSKDYVKLGTVRDGIYRLTPNDLAQTDVSVDFINPKTFKLILRGEEIPIYVSGEEDGAFDVDDYIEFVGLRNLGGHHREISSYGEPYKEYLNRYSDTTVYWLTWGEGNGLRAHAISQVGTPHRTYSHYREIVHIETDNWFDFSMESIVRRETPFWLENKTWHEGNLGVGTRNINFNVSDVYENDSVFLFTKLQSYATNLFENSHLLSLSLNGYEDGDTVSIARYEQKVLSAAYPAEFLNDGTNTLKIHSFETGAFPNLCIHDWDEIEYPRMLIPMEGKLIAQFPFILEPNLYQLNIRDISGENISVWRCGDEYKKYLLSPVGNSLEIVDSLTENTRIFLFNENEIYKPKIYCKKEFRNLRNNSNFANYLLITHPIFSDIAEDYASFISSSYSVTTKVVYVEDIYDEYSYGFFNPEAIKEFLQTTHVTWQTPSPEYVLLAGSATYDYYSNKHINQGYPVKHNYVPSFGAPQSDNWFVIWDTTGAAIPQMKIGRLPVENNEQFQWYFSKHMNYVEQPFTDWNKKYLFFSGGLGSSQTELDQLRSSNEFVINNVISPPPIGGLISHFYKTINPKTDFGPYTEEEINNAISEGGIFISYIGHSGTRIWDNSITEPVQLQNSVHHYPLVTDFGCSTARFGEPDVTSFSQLFTLSNDGQAIAYIGNSSLGFTSTAITFPKLFYTKLAKEGYLNVSDAHNEAKSELMTNYGSSLVNQVFSYTNTLIGDPIITLPIPTQPNLFIDNNGMRLMQPDINSSLDSVNIVIDFYNHGSVSTDSFNISVTQMYGGLVERNFDRRKILPGYSDSITISIPVKDKPGVHSIIVHLDSNDEIDELNTEDNYHEYEISVLSSSIRPLVHYEVSNGLRNEIIVVNPQSGGNANIITEISSYEDFSQPFQINTPQDSFFTQIDLSGILGNKRWWIKQKFEGSDSYSKTFSVFPSNYDYIVNDSYTFDLISKSNLIYNDGGLVLSDDTVNISVSSAGFNDGNYGIIKRNDADLVPSPNIRGHHVCIFNSENNYQFENYFHFDVHGGGSGVLNDYIQLLDTLSSKYLIAIAVADEGSISNNEFRNKIANYGSRYFSQVQFRSSWAFIGWKGASPEETIEAYSLATNGGVSIDTNFISLNGNGHFWTEKIGPAGNWRNIKLKSVINDNSGIVLKVFGYNSIGEIDSLASYAVDDSLISLSWINSEDYNFLKLKVEYENTESVVSPEVKSLAVSYEKSPELGTNYQTVSVENDTIAYRENGKLKFYVYNVGEHPAENFSIALKLIKPDNSSRLLKSYLVESIDSMSRKFFEYDYVSNKEEGTGEFKFLIDIDSENKYEEIIEDNNIYEIPFYVKPDSVTSIEQMKFEITFDGSEIFDGDYVAPNPDISITAQTPNSYSLIDTSSVEIYLDGKRIRQNELTSNTTATSQERTFNLLPELEDGKHLLKVIGKGTDGSIVQNVEKIFNVDSEVKLLSIYNYPNPFSDATNFTFRLTNVPEEITIKIYTVAGRLIRTLEIPAGLLKTDFNSIDWDGRDEDGDRIANGTYLYKIIAWGSENNYTAVKKLAIVR